MRCNLAPMSYVDLSMYLGQIADHPGKTREYVDGVISIERYPFLMGWKNHRNETVMCGDELNAFVTDVHIERYGEEWVAMPYLMDRAVRLYSSPVVFFIGMENDNGFGIKAYDWRPAMEKAGISESVIRRVALFLSNRQPADYK